MYNLNVLVAIQIFFFIVNVYLLLIVNFAKKKKRKSKYVIKTYKRILWN